MDTRDSISFIEGLKANRPELNFDRVADCGAGIGRVTKNLLLPLFAHVDLIEQSPRLLASSAEYIGEGHERTTCVELGLQVSALYSHPGAKLLKFAYLHRRIFALHRTLTT